MAKCGTYIDYYIAAGVRTNAIAAVGIWIDYCSIAAYSRHLSLTSVGSPTSQTFKNISQTNPP